MLIKLGIVTIDLKVDLTWNFRKEARVLQVLKEKGKIAAVRYYREDLHKRNIGLRESKDYVDAIEAKYNI